MVARTHSFALWGLEAIAIDVEVDLTPSERPSLVIVGLPDSAVKEAKDRVLTALKNSGYPLQKYCGMANLAPAHLRKEGPIYDLPLAVGLVAAMGRLKENPETTIVEEIPLFSHYLFAGELSLTGELRPIVGVLPMALLARKLSLRGVVVPKANEGEAASVPEIEVFGASDLASALAFCRGKCTPSDHKTFLFPQSLPLPSRGNDLLDIVGQQQAKRALEVAAAGGHNLLLSGPPGSGKSMLAKAIPTLLPPLTTEEVLETTQIHSIARLLPPGCCRIEQRPFRSPHHTISYAGLIGGGTTPRPGEVSLAHNGVLFLDELPEFARPVLEALRQPLEDRVVTISRAKGNATFPSRFICIAAMNPCPCGYLGHPTHPCQDTPQQIARYRSRVSGPLLDRFDLQIEVAPVSFLQMKEGGKENSATVQKRVIAARREQQSRLGEGRTNASMTRSELKKHAPLNHECEQVLELAMERFSLSARAADRLWRIAMTLCDLDPFLEKERILHPKHLMEALSMRLKTTNYPIPIPLRYQP